MSAHANRQKGDGDTATWLPPNKRFRCAYIARQVAVKLKFGVRVTAAERDAMRRVLSSCPKLRLPRFGSAPTVAVTTAQAIAPARPASDPTARVFANCTDARAAGVAPIRRGTPLYAANAELDRDQDGVACE